MDGKNFVGIGKILIDTSAVEWNIPALHFMVDNPHENFFEAVNLEFGLVAAGKNQEEACAALIDLTHHYIVAAMTKGKGFEEFKEVAHNSFMSEYWSEYRFFEFALAQHGQDLSHRLDDKITRAVQDLFDSKVKELISRKAEQAAADIIKEYEQMAFCKVRGVTYADIADIRIAA